MFKIDWETPHLWAQTTEEPHRLRAEPVGEAAVDVAVVGGGFTGLATALALSEAGVCTAVLEGNQIGSAASGRNNGLVIPHHSKAAPSEILAAFGQIYGKRYNAMVQEAARSAFTLVTKHDIKCHAVNTGWIQPGHSPRTIARMKQFHAEWKAEGADVAWMDGPEISERLGSRYLGGWMAREGGHINPYALTQGLARVVEQSGARIFENAKVTGLTRDGQSWQLTTANGGMVRAAKVFLATNALSGAIWPMLAQSIIPMQVYQAATAPVPEHLRDVILRGNPAVSDTRRDIRAFHYDRDFRIVTGGTHTVWVGAPEARGLRATRRMIAAAFPQLGPNPAIDHYWEGVFGVVPDRKPRLMRLGPGLVFGGIYSGRGVALSLSLGTRIGNWLAGKTTEDQLPLEVTGLRPIPAHPVAVQVARRIHPLHRVQDRFF